MVTLATCSSTFGFLTQKKGDLFSVLFLNHVYGSKVGYSSKLSVSNPH